MRATTNNAARSNASGAGSISRWISALRTGDEQAVALIWDRYRRQMRDVAERALGRCSRSVADEDDVVIDAFTVFLRRTSCGAYSAMSNRDDLWRLLAKITQTLAWRQSRFYSRLRRRTQSLSQKSLDQILGQLASGCPQPEAVVLMIETFEQLMKKIDCPDIRAVAIGRLKGFTNAELAECENCSVRTIERRLALIRDTWSRELDSCESVRRRG